MKTDQYKPCGTIDHGIGRKQFMGEFLTGAGAIAGTSLFSHPLGATEVAKHGKSVVVVYLNGGVSQFESWDPKTDLETGAVQVDSDDGSGHSHLRAAAAYGSADAPYGPDSQYQHGSR